MKYANPYAGLVVASDHPCHQVIYVFCPPWPPEAQADPVPVADAVPEPRSDERTDHQADTEAA